jgi:two-component system, cell cycle sensor histidine kinase and response regulator CckA
LEGSPHKPRFPWWVAVTLVVVVLVIAAGGVWSALDQKRIGREDTEDDLLATAQLKAGQITNWRAERLGDANVITATTPSSALIERWLGSGDPAVAAEIQAWFEALQQQYHYASVQLVDAGGKVLLGPQRGTLLMPSALEALRTALAGKKAVLTDLHLGSDGKTIHLDAIAPLFGSEASDVEPLGAVVLTANAGDFLFPLIQTWPTASESAETLLVEREGDHVLYLNELRHQKGTALTLTIPLTEIKVPAVQAVQGVSGIVEGIDYRGVEVLAAVRSLPDSPWSMVAKIDVSEVYSGVLMRSILIGVLTALLVAAIAVGTGLTWQWGLRRRYQDAYRAEISRRTLLARYEHLVQQANDVILLGDENMRIVEANERAVETYGYTRGELLELRVSDLVPPEDLAAFQTHTREVTEKGSNVVEATHRRKDGSVFPVEMSGRAFCVDDKKYVQAIIRDITGRKRAEARLRLTQFSIDHAADSVFWTDSDAHFLFVSDSTCLRLGYSRDEFLSMTLFDLDPSLTKERWTDAWERIKSGGTQKSETVHCSKKGEVFPVEVNTSFVEFDGRQYNCVFARDITERRQAEQALVVSEVGYRRLFEAARDGILILDGDSGEITNVNPFLEQLLGYSHEQLLGRKVWELGFLKDAFANRIKLEELKQMGYVRYEDLPLESSDGTALHVEFVSNVYEVDHRRVVQCNIRDMTERWRMEEALRDREDQLRQSQKMEAVGQLAGGIAHDFNNLLTAILGYSDLLLERQESTDSPIQAEIEQIRHAAERAASLTQQILAFSRRQPMRPTVVSLNQVLAGMEPLLRRTLGEDMDLVSRQDPDLGDVEVDVHQFEQVLMNLALNARDAMTSGGRLTLETRNVELYAEYCRTHPEVTPGSYVMLAVSDTGVGMDEAIRNRIFEPFFTTKEAGKGTGLGLSTVYGIVKQSGGSVSVYSELGEGTSFKIYLPRVAAQDRPVKAVLPEHAPGQGNEVIMVVEDEPPLRVLIERVLGSMGYQVICFGSADEAAVVLEQGDQTVHLLLTDVVLPGAMQGKDLFDKVQASMPDLPVLFMSGYTRNAIVHAGRLDDGVNLLEKPFTPAALGKMVRRVLDQAQLPG